METVGTIGALRRAVAAWRGSGERVAFVATMGNLHDGHLALVGRAAQLADRTVASIFVNPLQFGEGEDYATYPRTLDDDGRKLASSDVDLLFAPAVGVIYPGDPRQQTRVYVPAVSEILEGEFRPGFFTGVATVVCKLFNMVQPHITVFGEKDFQQLHVIRRMVEELQMPIEIVSAPTVREADGLAMSSRNSYLDARQRQLAPLLYHHLQRTAQAIADGEVDFARLEEAATVALQQEGFTVDYLTVRNAASLEPAAAEESSVVVLAAARLGSTRLIDNITISR
jgi:pantoate--beta-alanine ligase